MSVKSRLVRFASNRAFSSLATSIIGRGLPIFVIHRSASRKHQTRGLDPAYLDKCLYYIHSNKYTPISLSDIARSINDEIELPRRAVCFTMDDGYLDQAEVIAPIFLKYGYPLNFFVITDLLEANWWPWDAKVTWIIDNSGKLSFKFGFVHQPVDIRVATPDERKSARNCIRNLLKTVESDMIPEFIHELCAAAEVILPVTPPRPFQGMSWDIARELEARGIVFGPHSRSHNILSRLDDSGSAREISQSWDRLTHELSSPAKIFCYPTGRESDYGERELRTLENSGFSAAVNTIPGFVDRKKIRANRRLLYELPRFSMPHSFTDFIQCVTWIEYFKERLR